MPRDLSGRWIALAIVLLTLAGAIGSVWHHYTSSNAAQDFLGTAGMALVTRSPRAELLILGPTGSLADARGNQTQMADLSTAKGMLNLRHALRQDASYDFDAPVTAEPPWPFAIRFADDAKSITLAFDPPGRRVAVVETGRVARLAEKTAAGLAKFLEDFRPPDTATPSDTATPAAIPR